LPRKHLPQARVVVNQQYLSLYCSHIDAFVVRCVSYNQSGLGRKVVEA
jgi:hypothetical protein